MATPPSVGRLRQPLAHTALKWSALGVLTLLLTLGTNLFRPTIRGLQVSADIVRRSADYHEQIKANDALEQEVAFLRTDQGKDWAVHKYTGMIKPGEQVGRAVEDAQPAGSPRSRSERVHSWIAQRETASSDHLHALGQIMACYGGLRPPDQPPQRQKSAAQGRNDKVQTLSKQKSSSGPPVSAPGG